MFHGVPLPPLPAPWTQHTSPTGHPYYFNPITQESTYTRPLPTVITYASLGQNTSQSTSTKEKPQQKIPIPGTEWVRVKTNKGNIFWANKAQKKSLWTVPDEIKELVEGMSFDDDEDEENEAPIVDDVVETKKRKSPPVEPTEDSNRKGKRAKLEDPRPPPEPSKPEETAKPGDQDEDDDEWQRKMAEEMTNEDELGRMPNPDPEKTFEIPSNVALSLEEGKALFKALLIEANINPLHPWEKSLPLFISDSRYVLLKSENARREVFEEYCREAARQRRLQSASKTAAASDSSNPKDAFLSLLQQELTSTRTTFSAFRTQWKKDRRFFGYGRDEKEREKLFRSFQRELGERKREEKKLIEKAFLDMLGEKRDELRKDKDWKDVKSIFAKDPRYDKVGSSSAREELYSVYLKSLDTEDGMIHEGQYNGQNQEVSSKETKEQRRERAVREREAQVKAEQERIDRQNKKSRAGLDIEEAEATFNTLLTDYVRDPTTSFASAMSYLSTQPSFKTHCTNIQRNRLQHLFYAHLDHLKEKGKTSLASLFEAYAPELNIVWEDLPLDSRKSLISSGPAKKLAGGEEDSSVVQHEFEKWQRERWSASRIAFDAMLHENAFIEFWGRVGKMGLQDDDEKGRLGRVVFADESGKAEGEGEGEGGTADLQSLAKSVDLKEIMRVLRTDRRFTVFDHVPQEREQWIRAHLSQLTAPKASVHVPHH